MNRTKIEWADYSWNPVTGCLNDCWYCYGKKIATRFGEKYHKSDSKIHELVEYDGTRIDLKTDASIDYFSAGKLPVGWESHYPFGYEPTLHYNRLREPEEIKKPSKVFVCSMADLFGDWVPSTWINEILNTVKRANWHTYIFLTKFPYRYKEFTFPKNCWLGTTITGEEREKEEAGKVKAIEQITTHNINFISYEPLLGKPRYVAMVDWIIIGGLTPKPKHKPEWVDFLIEDYGLHNNIPIFVKPNLKWHEKIQEFPEGLK